MTKHERELLTEITDLQTEVCGDVRVCVKGPDVTFTNPITRNEIVSPYNRRETLEILNLLAKRGYLDRLDLPYREFAVTTVHYNAYFYREKVRRERLSFLLRSVLIPLLVSAASAVVTTLITLFFTASGSPV